ncbi:MULTISPECIES: hypothetical protein [unclassified Sphingobium]|uniref:hypothetical protein n=1 Tax=unclassified Sphingobium TaxID=2611147 RepID=UPI0035A64054
MLIVGVVIAAIALLLMPSTVSMEDMTTLSYTGSVIGTGRFIETYNMPRAQLREMVFQGGGLLFLAGIVLLAAGTIQEALSALISRTGRGGGEGDDAASESIDRPAFPPLPLDSDEAARNRKIIAGLVVAVVIALAVLGVMGMMRDARTATGRKSDEANAMAAADAAENASRAADNAMNAALRAADEAAAEAAR